jgi:hypothetical protein
MPWRSLVRILGRLSRGPLLRPLAALAVVAIFASRLGANVDSLAPSASAALAEALAARGLACSPGDVHWLRGPSGVSGALRGGGRAIVRARAGSDANDVYAVDVRLSPEGVPLEIGRIYDLTRTSSVDEESVALHGSMLAYVAAAGDVRTAIHVVDLAGRDVSAYADFSRVQKWQAAITNLQNTGDVRGVVHSVFTLDPIANHVTLAFRDDGDLAATADGRRIVIDPASERAIEGAGWVRVTPAQRAKPGNVVTWAVDRVREMQWFGVDRMQWLKAVAFTGLEWVRRAQHTVFGADTASAVAKDLGGVADLARPEFTDPAIGWPPAPIPPLLKHPIPGEGKWIPLGKDPFITPSYGLPSAFVTSFIRPDSEAEDSRVYVTMWDPRQIALHMQAGTVEPLSATGEAGPGAIPRAPEVMGRVVAGFNGGFQAMHGEYGMQADGVLYLPPKPYAATVLELRDGTTAFGSWPGPPPGTRSIAGMQVPDDVLSYRQNLTALIEHGKFNPWGRTWWGGTPPGWQDNIHTTRSGICLTKERFVGYFYGADVSAEALARAMLAARCDYAIHLDMNPGLVGFELYDVEPESQFKPLGRPLQADWEHEGTFSALPGFRYRARRMIRGMSEQNFPTYIHLDGRDFFYLTRRPLLPGRDLAALVTPPQAGEGAWRTKALPQHGFPYALATTTMRVPDEPSVALRVVRIDPRTVTRAGGAGTDEKTPTIALFTNPPTTTAGSALSFVPAGNGSFSIGATRPSDAFVLAATRPFAGGDPPAAAAGIDDEEGMLTWIELPPGQAPDARTRAAMARVLDALGCRTRAAIGTSAPAQIVLGGSLDAAGEPVAPPAGTVARLVRVTHPAARLYFDTPFVGPGTWQPLQMQRVRYFNRPKRQSDAGADAAADAGP